jgi:hypothetical protein
LIVGKSYLVVGDGNRPLLKSLELSRRDRLVVSDKPLGMAGLVEVLDLFKQFDELVALSRTLSDRDDLVLDLYSLASRLSAISNYASVRVFVRLCGVMVASAKAKCFNLYISYCGSRRSKLYEKLKSMVDEEVAC